MRAFLTLLAVGLVLTGLGFAAVFASLDGAIPMEAAFGGLALVLLGPIAFVAGLAVYALRRPTPTELARQKSDDYRTWHFRPAALLLLVAVFAVYIAASMWAEQYFPQINAGRHPPSQYIFALLCVSLLSIPKVRNLVVYTEQIRASRTADKAAGAGEIVAAEQPARD